MLYYCLYFIDVYVLETECGKPSGTYLRSILIGIFLSRFCIEFLKNNQEDFEENMILNMGQLLSIPFVLAGIYLVIRAMKQPTVSGRIENIKPKQQK